jgi:hypothetical protein
LSFVGVRARLDLLGAIRGDRLAKQVLLAWAEESAELGDVSAKIEAILVATAKADANRVDACVDALVALDDNGIATICALATGQGEDLANGLKRLKHARARLEAVVQDYRARYDCAFAGVEFLGDIPLVAAQPAVPNDGIAQRPLRLMTYLTFGIRDPHRRTARIGVQARAGLSYVDIKRPSRETFAFVFAANTNVAIQMPQGGQIYASAGAESRFGRSTSFSTNLDPSLVGNYVDLAVGISVPLTEQAGLSLGFRAPLYRELAAHGGSVFVNVDWWKLMAG